MNQKGALTIENHHLVIYASQYFKVLYIPFNKSMSSDSKVSQKENFLINTLCEVI